MASNPNPMGVMRMYDKGKRVLHVSVNTDMTHIKKANIMEQPHQPYGAAQHQVSTDKSHEESDGQPDVETTSKDMHDDKDDFVQIAHAS